MLANHEPTFDFPSIADKSSDRGSVIIRLFNTVNSVIVSHQISVLVINAIPQNLGLRW